jgi:hypothetical protein
MDSHKRILSILYIVSGSLQIIGMIIMALVVSTILPFILDRGDNDLEWLFVWILPFIQVIAVAVIVLFSIPAIIGGIALLNKKEWALTLLLVLGCFKLFSFPLGTALGVYTIWVYSNSKKESN